MNKAPYLLQAYLELVKPCTESPFVYHEWSLITSVAAMLGRQVWLPFGLDIVYPNMYTCLIGPPAGRKSAAISIAKRLAGEAGYKHFAKEKMSKEMFLSLLAQSFTGRNRKTDMSNNEVLDVEELLNQTEHELLDIVGQGYICIGELVDFLGANDLPFISLLTNLYDNLPQYDQPKLTGKDVFVNKPTINMLGGATPTTFSTMFPPEALGGGMLSRMLLIKGGGARQKLTIPPEPNHELYGQIVETLKHIKQNITGPITFSPEAFTVIDRIYKLDHPMNDSRLETYVGRRHMHLNKLCLILTAMNCESVVSYDTAVFANTLLHEAELDMPSALGEFGLSATSAQADSIMQAVTNSSKDVLKLWKIVSNDFKDRNEFNSVLMKLKDTGKIVVEHINGKATGKLIAAISNKNSKMIYYEPSLLDYRGNEDYEQADNTTARAVKAAG